MNGIIITLSILLICTISAFSFWPVTVEENLAISAEPDTFESYPQAISYSDGRIFVAFKKTGIGTVYQIIDSYGEFLFDISQPMLPAYVGDYSYPLWRPIIPDVFGGCIAAWKMVDLPAGEGIYAQRIDSGGNLLWGDDGVRVFPIAEGDFDICSDGSGGFYLAVSPNESTQDWTDLWLQKVTSNGTLPWGDDGVLVCGLPSISSRYPKIETDGAGGCIVVWDDNRPPYSSDGALYAQRYDSTGDNVWSQDLLVCVNPWAQWTETISDGEGGIIVQTNPGGSDYNRHYRINGQGTILWERDHLSWYYWGRMIPGEEGFFYLCFAHNLGLYAQRVDINGNNYWPSWGSGQDGALLYQLPTGFYLWPNEAMNLVYNSPLLYVIHAYRRASNILPSYYRINGLDSLGIRIWGDEGILVTTIDSLIIYNSNLIGYDDGGVTSVFMGNWDNSYDIYAKRINSDGSLGGPNAPIDEVTITVSGIDLTLNWPVQAPGAEYYIYKSFEPYVFPLSPVAVTNDTFFIDINGILQDSCFYRVTWHP